MKTVLLVRHAKSDWADPSLADIDRPLNDRGEKDAPAMAERLRERKIQIDAFISSPAKRARKTARAFAKAYKKEKKDIIIEPSLYEAGEDAFYKVIASAKDKHDTIALFSHNPGITGFANELTEARIDNIPTSGVFAVRVDCKKWEDFKEAKKEYWFFDFPKNIDES
jgi:phosphohistidine phosphatase